MAIISNLNTKQTPISAAGLTGIQTVKFVVGPRVYIKNPDPLTSPVPVTVKSNGTLPSGWTDMGVVNGAVKITYTKSVKEVRTGVEQVLRGEYIDKRTGSIEADLAQFDDTVVGQASGLTASVFTAGSIVQFGMGQESIVTKALLLVMQSVLDGKEVQLYNPACFMSFGYSNSGDEVSLKMTGEFQFFTWQGADTMFVQSHFA